MSDLSEEAYYACWMDGLEFTLWEAVLGVRVRYGQIGINPDSREQLRALSEACDGWIIFDDVRDDLGEPCRVGRDVRSPVGRFPFLIRALVTASRGPSP